MGRRENRAAGKAARIIALCFLLFLCPFAPSVPAAAAEAAQEKVQPDYFTMLELDDFTVRLYYVLDWESGDEKIILQLRNSSERPVTVSGEGFLLSGEIMTDSYCYVTTEPGEVKDYTVSGLLDRASDMEENGEKISKVSFQAYIYAPGEDGRSEVLYRGDCTAVIPEGYEPSMICEPAMSMRVEEQILREDDTVRLVLKSMGRYIGFSNYYAVEGILMAENLSDGSIPVYLQAIKFNGYTITPLVSNEGMLEPGARVYLPFQCSADSLRQNDITGISSASLQVMTSEQENTGVRFTHSGGAWYPVTLAESAPERGDASEGIPLYEDDYVRIGLLHADSHSYETSDFTSIKWKLSLVNKTDRDLEVRFDDYLENGVLHEEEFGYNYSMIASVGRGSRTNAELSRNVKMKNAPFPEVSFRVRVQSPGGGTLYQYSKEHTKITAEMTDSVKGTQ